MASVIMAEGKGLVDWRRETAGEENVAKFCVAAFVLINPELWRSLMMPMVERAVSALWSQPPQPASNKK